MINEVFNKYDVDGVFLDCIPVCQCYCDKCMDIMKNEGVDIENDASIEHYVKRKALHFAQKLFKNIPENKSLFFNGIPYKDVSPYVSHIEIECLPSGGHGYDNFPVKVRYLRNIGKQVIAMFGRFHLSWGDIEGIRTIEGLRFDCLLAVSNGVSICVGDHLHPKGNLNQSMCHSVKKIYHELQDLNQWIEDVTPKTEIGIVLPSSDKPSPSPTSISPAVAGAVRALTELNYQVDVIDQEMDFSKYELLILPDNVLVSDQLKYRLNEYCENGKAILSSNFSGLDAERGEFALDNYHLKYHGEENYRTYFMEVEPDVAEDMPSAPFTIYEKGIKIEPENKISKILARIIKPYIYDKWESLPDYLYVAPDQIEEKTGIIQFGHNIHIAFPIFSAYYQYAYPVYKTLLSNCIKRLLPCPLIKTSNVPSFARITLAEKENMTIIHFLAYLPEMRGEFQIIEEGLIVKNAEILLRTDNKKVNCVHSAPENEEIDFTTDGKYLRITIPEFKGYKMIVTKWKNP
jgi:hypothetical protein